MIAFRPTVDILLIIHLVITDLKAKRQLQNLINSIMESYTSPTFWSLTHRDTHTLPP